LQRFSGYRSAPHLYITQTGGSSAGKTGSIETIYLNDAAYVMVGGPWQQGALSNKELIEEKKKSEQLNGAQCSAVRDEAVNGEPAILYKIHALTPAVDSRIWISKSKGLPLKQIDDSEAEGSRY
jgi:hypothetical protein